jgi:nucleoside-diphosphate-sugar epimerase
MNYKIVGITGHTGVLGKALIKKFKKNKKFKIYKFFGDIRKKKDVQLWLKNKKFDVIFHLAAIVATSKVEKFYNDALKVNYIGTKILVDEIIKRNSTDWFFFSSTSHVYSFSNKRIKEDSKLQPISKYGTTKLKAEKYIEKRLFQIKFCIGRIFSYTHHTQEDLFFVPSLYKKFITQKKIELTSINHVRDFLILSDVLSAIQILYKNKSTGFFNIASGSGTRLIKIPTFFSKVFKKNFSIKKNNKKETRQVGNITKILKLGWKPKKSINDILKSFLTANSKN